MTKRERLAWESWTKSSSHQWTLDPVHNKEGGLLFHIGGENGVYLAIKDSCVTTGEYHEALPHIGDATFKETGHRYFGSFKEAIEYCLNHLGRNFLMAYMGFNGTPYLYSKVRR